MATNYAQSEEKKQLCRKIKNARSEESDASAMYARMQAQCLRAGLGKTTCGVFGPIIKQEQSHYLKLDKFWDRHCLKR